MILVPPWPLLYQVKHLIEIFLSRIKVLKTINQESNAQNLSCDCSSPKKSNFEGSPNRNRVESLRLIATTSSVSKSDEYLIVLTIIGKTQNKLTKSTIYNIRISPPATVWCSEACQISDVGRCSSPMIIISQRPKKLFHLKNFPNSFLDCVQELVFHLHRSSWHWWNCFYRHWGSVRSRSVGQEPINISAFFFHFHEINWLTRVKF